MLWSNNPAPSVLLVEGTTPTTPDAGKWRLFMRATDGHLMLVDEAGSVWPVGPLVIRKAADEPVVNDTLQNDDELAFPIGASEKWQFECVLFVTNAANTGDIKITWTLPASCTISWSMIGAIVAATGADSDVRISGRFQDTSGAGAITMGIQSGAPTAIRISAMVENSTNAGTVQLQWAQGTTDGGNATIVKEDSYISAVRVA